MPSSRSDHLLRIGEGDLGPGSTETWTTRVYLQLQDRQDLDQLSVVAEQVR